ncbi:hypothetical protein HOY82DRAFT_559310 [Tuber indicum]|nr:hypothetical protein HOY82DRAFT_559310 [Tuber indicum]
MNQAAIRLGVILWYMIHPSHPARHSLLSSNDKYALVNKGWDEGDGDSGSPSYHGRNGSVSSYGTGYDVHPSNSVPWDGEGSAYNEIGAHGPAAMGENRRTPSGLSMLMTPDEDYSYRERQ